MVIDSDIQSRGIQRVVSALEARSIDLPLRVLHVNGRIDWVQRQIEQWGGEYVITQYCLRSTQKPSTSDWLPIWEAARCVWSYYDLPALCAEDGNEARFTFYRSPLGIEPAFRARPAVKKFTVCTHGDYLTQSTRECVLAADWALHLGERFKHYQQISFVRDVTDDELAALYSSCQYVCGLRRVEGFELPAAEGLACGARPVLFDREHYRHWYEDHAEYVQEGPREEVLEELRELFAKRSHVTPAESTWAREQFNWDKIIDGFYAHL